MRIDKAKIVVSFDFSPETHFLVHGKDDRFGDNGGFRLECWTLNPRIDMSYKGKADQVAIPTIYLSEKEAEQCKEAGFECINE